MILALVLYASFGLVDYFMLDEHFEVVITIRFGVIIPILLIIILCIYYFKNIEHIKLVLLMYILTGTIGILVFLSYANPDDTAYKLYFIGLLMVCLWAQLITFPSYLSSYIVFTIHLLYILVAIFKMDMLRQDMGLFLGSNLFFLSSDLLGFYASRALSHFILKDNEKTRELIRLNESRTKLITVLSHDIRGPLLNINSLLGLYERKLISNDEFISYNKKLGDSINSVENILCSILNWSNTLLKEDNLKLTQIPLRKLIGQTLEQYKIIADEKQIMLVNAVPRNIVLNSDENLTLLIIRNLISNAIKFTTNGRVIITSEIDRDKATIIKIVDEGVGMTEEQINKINMSGQISSSLGTKNEKGIGLGLWMCMDFLKLIKGEISVVSEVGKGSTFVVKFPVFQNQKPTLTYN